MNGLRIAALRAANAFLFLVVMFGFAAAATAAERGFLGMHVQGISPKIAGALQLEKPAGVLVRDISVDGPAAHAGIRRGDLIVKMHGTEIDTFERLVQISKGLAPGNDVEIELLRLGETIDVTMTVGDWPEAWNVTESAFAALPELGLTFASLTAKLRKRLGVRWGSTGILVTLADPAFINATPLRRGDVVTQINQTGVWKPKQFLDAFAQAREDGRRTMLLLVERSDGFRYLLQPVLQLGASGVEPPVFKIPGQQGG